MVDKIIRYENGEMNEDETVQFTMVVLLAL